MRPFLAPLLLAAVAASAPPAGAVDARYWSGAGRTNDASEAANWGAGIPPRDGDRAVFTGFSSKDCVWDYDVLLSSLTLSSQYGGRVSLGKANVQVLKNVRVAGGTLDLAEGTLVVRDRVYVERGGVVELARGELRLGERGLLVDNDGDFRSTGDKPARILAAGRNSFPFVVGKGKVQLENKAGTTVSGSKGIVLYSAATVASAANVRVEQVSGGASGVKVFNRDQKKIELKDWSFDETVARKVELPDAPKDAPPPVVLVMTEEAAPAEPEEEGAAAAGPQASLDSGLTFEDDEGVQVTPLYTAQLLGGQYFFDGDKGNLTGNAGVLAAPSVRFNERWTLLPTYAGNYRGTKQVVDLVGAGSLFQQRMDHRLGARAVYTPEESPWRIKPSASLKAEFLKETRDEDWGEGLFDYRKLGVGVEAEYVYRDPFSVRVAYDYASTHFPNYTSLESQQAVDFNGQPLARELVGGHVLDNTGHALTLGGSMQLRPGWLLEASGVVLLQHYPNQRIVALSGGLTPDLRDDTTLVLDAALRHPRRLSGDRRMLASLGAGAVSTRSDQNSYDALNSKFIGGYYDYDELGLRAGLTMLWGGIAPGTKPTSLGLSLSGATRSYKERPTQDSAGAYQGSKLKQTRWAAALSGAIPMDANYSLTANVQLGEASSNMGFQQFYTYDYRTMNWLFGVNYEY